MSIANNVERIINAKADIKTAIESRGVSIDTNATIDTYSEAIDSCPYSVRGYFTPEEDTNVFTIGNLPFKPSAFNISNLELFNNIYPYAIITYGQMNGYLGLLIAGNSAGTSTTGVAIKVNSSAVVWTDDSFSLNIPASQRYTFKAGYTYEYVVSGGFE